MPLFGHRTSTDSGSRAGKNNKVNNSEKHKLYIIMLPFHCTCCVSIRLHVANCWLPLSEVLMPIYLTLIMTSTCPTVTSEVSSEGSRWVFRPHELQKLSDMWSIFPAAKTGAFVCSVGSSVGHLKANDGAVAGAWTRMACRSRQALNPRAAWVVKIPTWLKQRRLKLHHWFEMKDHHTESKVVQDSLTFNSSLAGYRLQDQGLLFCLLAPSAEHITTILIIQYLPLMTVDVKFMLVCVIIQSTVTLKETVEIMFLYFPSN